MMVLITERRRKQNEIDNKISTMYDELREANPTASNALIQREIARRMKRTPQAIYNRLRLMGKIRIMA